MFDKKSILSKIPSVDELLKYKEIDELMTVCPRPVLVQVIRDCLTEYRNTIFSLEPGMPEGQDIKIEEILQNIKTKVHKKMSYNLKRVINATGVVIHTNLGRSPLSEEVHSHLLGTSFGYSNLEMDMEKGIRGSRYEHVEDILKELTKAESAMVVNNNAAAVMLVLSTLAKNKEVIVSRGQLIEIGGSFRIPDVMRESGAKLVEVGTTNKTHLSDYEKAINEETAALMKVHTSNYKILGFTEEVSSEVLVSLARINNVPVIEDIGSGVFIDLSKYGLPYEPTVQNAIACGMDAVTFSGDKMLGGPQAGIIVGKKEYIDKMKKNPLTRAIRIDKMTLAALEGTLKLYLDEEKAIRSIPVLNMLTMDISTLSKKAQDLYEILTNNLNLPCQIKIIDEFSETGGGAMPLHKLPTKVISIDCDIITANELDKRLRGYKTPIITRIFKDKVLMDLRTIMEDDYYTIAEAIKAALL